MSLIVNKNVFTLSGAELYSQPAAGHPEGGALYRAVRRIKERNDFLRRNNQSVLDRELSRSIYAGEVGELAATRYFEAQGYNVQQVSWREFTEAPRGEESVVDLILTAPGRPTMTVQVKASEYGLRTIQPTALRRYQHRVDRIVFVAIREKSKKNKNGNMKLPVFECYVSSSVSPDQIPRLKTWETRPNHLGHVDNSRFRKEWICGVERKMEGRFVNYDLIGCHNYI